MEQYPGAPADSLMAEGYFESSEMSSKHEVFIQNSPYDLARNIVKKDCPGCKLNFITMIRVGSQETLIFTCDCGYRATLEEYNRDIESGKAKNIIKESDE